jgi:hypothetical protein
MIMKGDRTERAQSACARGSKATDRVRTLLEKLKKANNFANAAAKLARWALKRTHPRM